MSESDIFKDNPELFTTGSFKEIATRIDKEWWEDKRKQLSRLSGSLDTELIEFLPEELRKGLLGSPEEFDEENPPDDSFLLQVFKRNEGKSFEVVCNNKIRKDCRKLTMCRGMQGIHHLRPINRNDCQIAFTLN